MLKATEIDYCRRRRSDQERKKLANKKIRETIIVRYTIVEHIQKKQLDWLGIYNVCQRQESLNKLCGENRAEGGNVK